MLSGEYFSSDSLKKSVHDSIFRVISPIDKVLLFLSLLAGFYGAIASSYTSFSDLVNPGTFVKPCWLNASSADPSPSVNKTL